MTVATDSPPIQATQARRARILSDQIILFLLVLMGYAAVVITGYAMLGFTRGSREQPVPLYIFVAILLLALQMRISRNRSISRALYLFITSGLALVYAAYVIFGGNENNFTRSPLFYIIVMILLVGVFLFDAVDRRRSAPRGLESQPPQGPSQREPFTVTSGLASDFTGLAVLFYTTAFLQDLLGNQILLQRFGLPPLTHPHVVVDLNQVFGFRLIGEPLNHLEALDLGIALGATAVALLLLGLLGILTVATPQQHITPRPMDQLNANVLGISLRPITPVLQFLEQQRTIIAPAIDQVLLSLRLVLGPLVWLIPAFSLASYSRAATDYFNLSSEHPSTDIAQLFLPWNKTALNTLPQGAFQLVLASLAIGAVIMAVAVVEHDAAVLSNTFRVLRVAGRALALTLAFFLYSLAALNAFTIFVLHGTTEPFQLGMAAVFALMLGIVFAIYGFVVERAKVHSAAHNEELGSADSSDGA
jgi:hypothetical protein